VAVAFVAALVLTGCGYRDDNRAAAEVVARAYFDAYNARDAAAVCAVMGPDLQPVLAAQAAGSCETFVKQRFPSGGASLRPGNTTQPAEGRVRVAVSGSPGHYVGVARYGSTWRLVEAWPFTPG
jgi:hypothetical protein